jgi:hypothetical protein
MRLDQGPSLMGVGSTVQHQKAKKPISEMDLLLSFAFERRRSNFAPFVAQEMVEEV